MSKIKKLIEGKKRISKEIFAIQDEIAKEKLAELQSLVGTCYKYPNSDGTNKFSTYFQVHKVTDVYVNDNGEVYNVVVDGIEFSDAKDRIEIEYSKYSYLSTWDNYPITVGEYKKALNKILAKFFVLGQS